MTYQKIEAIYLLEILLKYYTLESVVENRPEIVAAFDGEFGLGSTIPKEPKELDAEEAKALANNWLARDIGKIYTPESLASERINIQSNIDKLVELGGGNKNLTPGERELFFTMAGMIAKYGAERLANMLRDAESLGLLQAEPEPESENETEENGE